MEIFKLFGSILIDSAEAEKSISKTEDKAESLGSKLGSGLKTAAKWGTAIVGAATAVGGAMVAATKSTAENLDTIDKASQRMKISAESYQELAYAAELSGVQMSTLEKAAKQLEGTGMSLDSALDSIMAYETAEERAAAAAELLGDSVAYQLTPMLNAGAEGMEAAKQEAHDLGLVMSDETVSAGASMNDMFSKVEKSIGTLKNGLVAELMPYVAEILQWVIDNIPTIKETVGGVMDAILPLVKMVLDFVMQALPPLLNAIKKFLDWIMPYLRPILDAVGKLLEGLFALLEGDTDTFVQNIKDVFIGLGTALFDIGKDIFTSLWDGIKDVWGNIKGWIDEKVSWVADKLAFWKNSNNQMQTDGSHASGLPYVPYDGYVAELHRGEAVLPASQVQQLIGEGGFMPASSRSQQVHVTIPLKVGGDTWARAEYTINMNEQTRRGQSLVSGGQMA